MHQAFHHKFFGFPLIPPQAGLTNLIAQSLLRNHNEEDIKCQPFGRKAFCHYQEPSF